ncbi:hypothetical protein OG302_38340 [Streptomyces sp. NBC_01283]|uniref:hypothetical protein n=1 Tax=Streptomyces sp. NBC_01283 TaxID=2903812 RepID=UPI00352D2D08|nr:hypothetical protein OG302_38340 [Streptomyces sp. NBC_01283]
MSRRRRLLVAAVAVIAADAGAYPVLDLGGRPAASASAARFLNDMKAGKLKRHPRRASGR